MTHNNQKTTLAIILLLVFAACVIAAESEFKVIVTGGNYPTGKAVVTFTATAPNATNVTTEFLLQPLANINRKPQKKGYRSKGLFTFVTGTLTHAITVWHILGLYVFQGLVNAFDIPARQAFVVQMVDNRDDLPNAIALNSSMVNVARLIGPSIAGVIIAATNEGICFLIDGISYIGVIVALGTFAGRALLRTLDPISRLRGRVYEFRGAKLVPTFHPAYLLRNPASKREVWEDMKMVRKLLTQPTTEDAEDAEVQS